ASGSDRVIRGGSWSSNPQVCRVADRSDNSPGNRSGSLGFRLARTK
ncbi:MAG: SUMF1/EgtB/PvdO family nonheme iron enzyme, partial [Saprospiraceae bacterium]